MCVLYTPVLPPTSLFCWILPPQMLEKPRVQASILHPHPHSLAYLCKYDYGCQLSLHLTSFLNCIYSIASSKSTLECLINILTYTKMELLVFAPKTAQFSSGAQLCPPLCSSMDCSTPGFPVHHQLPELAQTPVCGLSDAIQRSHPLSSPSHAFNLSQNQGLFQGVSSSHQVAKVLEFVLQYQSFP